MTLVQILRALGRRWYVLLIGVLITAGAAALAVQVDGVYTARSAVTFMPPVGWAVAGNTFTDSATTLVGFAKVVEETLTDGEGGQLFAAAGTPLYGGGVRSGEIVYVPNYGGQWAPNFNQPALIVDVVAPTASEVDERVRALTDRIGEIAVQRQDEMGVLADQRITTYANPASPEIAYVGPNRTRALAGIALLGAGVSVSAALLLDRVLARRGRARAPHLSI